MISKNTDNKVATGSRIYFSLENMFQIIPSRYEILYLNVLALRSVFNPFFIRGLLIL